MSHYSQMKTKVKKLSALVKTLQEVDGGRWKNCVEVHEGEGTNLIGYRGDKRSQKANVVIRRSNVGEASNDLGFVRTNDGTYEAIISDFDASRYNKDWLNMVNQHYSKNVIKEVAHQQGYSVEVIEQGQELFVNCERN